MSKLSTFNRCLQYTFLIGALGWIFGRGLLPSHTIFAISRVELALIMFSLGLPGVTVLMPLVHPEPGVRLSALQYGIVGSILLILISAGAGLPVATVSAAASLCTICLFSPLNRLLTRVYQAVIARNN